MTDHDAILVPLSDTGQTVANPAEDIRGRTVCDSAGEEIGQVTDLLVDKAEGKVRLVRVEHGGLLGFGARPVFVPVEVIAAVSADQVRIASPHHRVAKAPPYDPELIDQRSYVNSLYEYYGYAPFWAPGYMYPPFPPGPARTP